MRYVVTAVGVSFLVLVLSAVGFLPLPGFVETVVKWIFGLGIVIGVVAFGPRFVRKVFGG